ncbi:MAG: amidohydrolase family protein [Gammaproteobacteria bacterium]
MSELTLAIRNARIVDGTGAPAFAGDVGVLGDRITAVGRVEGRAAVEVDAAGRVLAPGFIDPHTHYDPQLCWDGLATPSPEHGVTTLIAGNCSLSLAPVRPEGRDRVTRLFGVVEDLHYSCFEAGVSYAWESFPEYVRSMRGRLGPNVGVFVGHSVLRLYVMGAAAQERAATPEELGRMCELLQEAVRGGAFGLSYSFGHLDEHGRKLPCSFATFEERLALADALARIGRGMVETTPNFADPGNVMALIDECGEIASRTGVTHTYSPILYTPNLGDTWLRMLTKFSSWRARGAPLYAQTQTRPLDQTFRLSRGSLALTKLPTWSGIMHSALPERIAALSDRLQWGRLDAELKPLRGFFDNVSVKNVETGQYRRYIGRKVRDIAAEEKRSYTEVMLDIALADDLEAEFALTDYIHADAERVAVLLGHPGLHIGSADAGAHIGQFAGAGDTCYLFERFVRGAKLFSLEHAVQRLSGDIARDWKIADRGTIATGRLADLVVFDPDTIARGEEVYVNDVPGGTGRYVRHPQGIAQVVVNGEVLVDRGEYTAARPGRVV